MRGETSHFLIIFLYQPKRDLPKSGPRFGVEGGFSQGPGGRHRLPGGVKTPPYKAPVSGSS